MINPVRSAAASRASSLGSVGDHTLLRRGASGPEVKQLQESLRAAGIEIAVSGTFDAQTDAAVRQYQQAKGLQVDGLVGQQTWGSFMGQSFPPGTHMLRGGATGGHAHGADDGHDHAKIERSSDSFLSGPSKSVAAYVNGRPQTIQVVAVGGGEYLRADAAKAFLAMQAEARKAGINIGATSSFRTMSEQQELYRRYLNGTGNLAAKPGYSNHQNGIAMDISGVGGRGTAADRWLLANAGRFGFKNLPSEFWHYDFVG